MYRLIKLNAHGRPSVWWTKGATLREIAQDRLVAIEIDDRWMCESGGKWSDAGICAYGLAEIPCWPEEAILPEHVVATATEYIKYEKCIA